MLLDAGIQPNSNCASRAIGYRQAGEALQRWHADPESITEQSVVSGGLLCCSQPSCAATVGAVHAAVFMPQAACATAEACCSEARQEPAPCDGRRASASRLAIHLRSRLSIHLHSFGTLVLPQIQAVQAVQAASRQLCHKQMTWFRDEEMFRSAVAGILFHRIVGACGVLWSIGVGGAECVCAGQQCLTAEACAMQTHIRMLAR